MSEAGAARTEVAVVTYHGIDGACAAAMVLQAYPQASVHISSACRIGVTLQEIVDQRLNTLSEIHICGLGVCCERESVLAPLRTPDPHPPFPRENPGTGIGSA